MVFNEGENIEKYFKKFYNQDSESIIYVHSTTIVNKVILYEK